MTVLMLFTLKASAQPQNGNTSGNSDSLSLKSVEISLLTCQPHAEVYSLYGHTAIRVQNPERGMDIAINWGVFDTTQSNFSLRFIFGLTDYTMGIIPTDMFIREYEYYGAAVYQQRLNLTDAEKISIMQALDRNYQPENRVYRYNFFYDNCTSRARDVILAGIQGKVDFRPTMMQKGERSFRKLIHWKNNGYNWCAVGNDLLLGVGADRNTTHDEREFLPEILSADFDSATIMRADGKAVALVDSAFWLLQPGQGEFEAMPDFPLSPTLCALLVLVLVVAWTTVEIFKLKRRIKGLDVALFYIFGLIGLILVAMWFSEHPTVKVNLQIFVFCPLWLYLMSPWTKWKYRLQTATILLMLFFLGNFIQCYAEGMNILALALLVRIYANVRFNKQKVSE